MFSHLTHTTIRIQAPPAHVRKVFLDWTSYTEWSHEFIKKLEVTNKSGTTSSATEASGLATDLGPPVDTTINVVLKNMSFSAVTVTNTANEFAWLGKLPIPYIFEGRHAFAFDPAPDAPGETEFSQSEAFSGIAVILLKTSFGTQTETNYKKFNEELKKRCEDTYKL